MCDIFYKVPILFSKLAVRKCLTNSVKGSERLRRSEGLESRWLLAKNSTEIASDLLSKNEGMHGKNLSRPLTFVGFQTIATVNQQIIGKAWIRVNLSIHKHYFGRLKHIWQNERKCNVS